MSSWTRIRKAVLCGARACVAMSFDANNAAGEPDAPKPDPGAAALKAKADEIFAASLKRYREMDAYREKASLIVRMKFLDDTGEDVGVNQETASTLVAARPNRFKSTSEHMSFASDGKRFRFRMVGAQSKLLEVDAEKDFALSEDVAMSLGWAGGSPVMAAMNRNDDDVWTLFPALQSVAAVQKVNLDGVACTRIDLKAEIPMLAGDEPVDVSVWIDDGTRLLKRLNVDYTEGARKQREEMGEYQADVDPYAGYKLEQAYFTYVIDEAEVNPSVSDNDFEMQVSDEDQKVETFMAMFDQGAVPILIGEPAPDFESTDFDDKPIKLSDLKGKVVVLDFWATWCGPCVQAIPHIQEVAERMKDKPVVVLGINGDQPGGEKRVKQFLEKKKITFRQVKDFMGEIKANYGVTSIPCTVLIGKDGIVQSIDVGFGFGGESELTAKIEKLIDGKRLFDAEQIASQKAATSSGGDVPSPLPEVEADRLSKGDLLSGASALYASGDLNQDGVEDLLFGNYAGGRTLRILYGGTTEFAKVQFEGIRPNEAFQNVTIVDVDGKPHVVCLLSGYGQRNGYSNKIRLGMFRPDGARVWILDLDVPDQVSAQANLLVGDVDGVPGPELALTLGLSRILESGAGSVSTQQYSSYLLLVDLKGHVIVRKRLQSAGDSLVKILPGDPPTLLVSESYHSVRRYHLTSLTPEIHARKDSGSSTASRP
ncbi:MAG: redoxin domain-containing protein [Phycisphaerales bacterium]|nr:redoxin domain-containing protein [Phycisphaerales bacterium]MCB9856283.1 redoxin domain-containing protein [Phycisphaerales bacterium]MCB9863278.1 redoxin domain-containing protein [Phycisphaerales bacterium]